MAAPAINEPEICVRMMVDEAKNKVVFVQAGNDFVDVLLSFFTLPLGTIARLVHEESNIMEKVRFGGISSVYESVANMEEKQFMTGACKEMLLRPRNSMEAYCRNLKFNFDDTEKTKYFICENWNCSRHSSGGLLSTFRNLRCMCGKPMSREIFHSDDSPANRKFDNKGFVLHSATFIILDDLTLMPDNFQSTISLARNLGYENFDAMKPVTVNVTRKEIMDLLNFSLFIESETTLTDVLLLKKKQFLENAVNAQSVSVLDFDFDGGEIEAHSGVETIKVKIMLRKSDKTIAFALAEKDFADFILSFLTFPLGAVENLINGNFCGRSIGNLYKSMIDLDPNIYLSSPDLKDKLVKPQLAHQFKLRHQILPIDEVTAFDYSCSSKYDSNKFNYSGSLTALRKYYNSKRYVNICAPLSYLDPQSSTCEAYSKCGGRGFTKGPSLYMVTDDLVITPDSSDYAISILTKLKISLSDLEERVITIGKKEGLSLLKASLFSSSALTDGLGPFLKLKHE